MVAYLPMFGDDGSFEDIVARILDGLAERIPGWTPGGEGTLEVALAEEIGREIGDLYRQIQTRAANDFIYLGVTLFGVQSLPGATATIPVTLTLARPNTTIPAGFTVIGLTTDNVEVAFHLETARPTGAATTITATLVANEVGAYANDVPPGSLRIVTATEAVQTVTATAASDGGLDPETAQEYLDRLVTTLSTLTRTPILPGDFAVRSRDITGVHRALAIDGYNPDNATSGNERYVTVFPVDEDGKPVPTEIRNQLLALLDGLREVNFVVKAATPTYTPVHISFSAVAEDGYVPADVRTAVIARGLQLLSPATFAGGDKQPPEWTGDKVVRYLDLVKQLSSVPGVGYLTGLTINGGTVDVTLPGVAALPAPADASSPTTVSGTVA